MASRESGRACVGDKGGRDLGETHELLLATKLWFLEVSEDTQMLIYPEEATQDSMLDHSLTSGETTGAKGYEGMNIHVGYGLA